MESLYKLYSNDNFGIGLFIVVTILAFSFLIILFFGKKDEKERKIKKQIEDNNTDIEEVSLNNAQTLDNMTLGNTEIVNETPIVPVTENVVPVEQFEPAVENINNVTEEKPIEAPKEESFDPFANASMILENSKENQINNDKGLGELANALNEEFAKVETPLEPVITNETPVMTDNINVSAPIIEEEKVPNIFSNENKVNTETELAKPKPTFSNQFSSVYVNKQINDSIAETISEPAVEKVYEPVTEINNVAEIKPVKPEFELPKTLDLPKLNKEGNNDNIIKTTQENVSGIENIMNSLEDESFTIEKE